MRRCVVNPESDASTKDDALLRALARWEWEGGHIAPDTEKHTALKRKEEHILQSEKTATHD